MPKRQRPHGSDNVLIQNSWKPDIFAHTEHGGVKAGTINFAWHSAQWILAEVQGGFVTIRNFWKPNHYLHCQKHRLEAGVIQKHWWSSMWKLHRLDGGAFRIENRWKRGHFLHIENGTLELGGIHPKWLSARWVLRSASERSKVPKKMSSLQVSLQPLLVPGGAKQRQIGRDKCLALALQSGLRIFARRDTAAAAEHVRKHGFAVMESVLSESVLQTVQKGYARAIQIAVQSNPNGNRGRLRYSISQWKQLWEICMPLVDQPEIIDVMRHYFRCKFEDICATSFHGDFSLPGVGQQGMHIDMESARGGNPEMAPELMVYYNMIDHDDRTGPTRFVKGSQKRLSLGREVKEEASVLAFAPRGSAIIMDRRTWHGGTRNVSSFARPMLGPQYCGPRSNCRYQRCIDPERFAKLSPLGQQVCRKLTA
jgi:hypothetical protein